MVVVDNAAVAVDTPNSYPSSTTQSQTWTLLQHQDQGPHEEVKQLPSQAVQQAPNSNVEVQLEDVAAVADAIRLRVGLACDSTLAVLTDRTRRRFDSLLSSEERGFSIDEGERYGNGLLLKPDPSD